METSRPHLKRALWHFCPRYRQNFWDGNIPAPLKLADQQVIEAYKFRFPGWKHPGPIEIRMTDGYLASFAQFAPRSQGPRQWIGVHYPNMRAFWVLLALSSLGLAQPYINYRGIVN